MEKVILRGLVGLLALLTALWFVWGARFAVGLPEAPALALTGAGWLWIVALFVLAWRQGWGRWWALTGAMLVAFPLLTVLILSTIPNDFQITFAAFVVAEGWSWLPLLPLLVGFGVVWWGTKATP